MTRRTSTMTKCFATVRPVPRSLFSNPRVGIDGELLELGRQFDALRAQANTLRAQDFDDDDCEDPSQALACKIIDLPASTLAGLAVKARAAQFACDQEMARKLIDSVIAFAR
jgi:hypothetical protein